MRNEKPTCPGLWRGLDRPHDHCLGCVPAPQGVLTEGDRELLDAVLHVLDYNNHIATASRLRAFRDRLTGAQEEKR
jgi:hypothetical protein